MFKPVTPSAKHSNLPVDNQEIISAKLAIIWLTRFFVVPSSSKQFESVNWLQVCPNNKDSSNLILATRGGNMKSRERWFRRVMAFAFYLKYPKIERFHFRFLSHAIWAFHISSCTVVKSMSKIETATVWRLTQMDGNLTKLLMRRKKCWWNCFGTNLRHFSKFSLWLSIHSGILTCLSIWYTDLTTEWPKKRI